jgi:hypothetical protein
LKRSRTIGPRVRVAAVLFALVIALLPAAHMIFTAAAAGYTPFAREVETREISF